MQLLRSFHVYNSIAKVVVFQVTEMSDKTLVATDETGEVWQALYEEEVLSDLICKQT